MSDGNTIQLLIAIATFLAVIVALFDEWFWMIIEKPKIEVFFNNKQPNFYHQTNQTIPIEITKDVFELHLLPAYYVRLGIKNNGVRTLENTEVVLERVYPRQTSFIPLNLSWSSQVPDLTGISRTVSIAQGQSRIVDIAEFTEPIKTLEIANKKKGIDQERYKKYSKGFRCCSIKPHSFSDIFPYGNYIFEIGIYADNVKPKYIKLSIKYDGKWEKNKTEVMRNKHLVVKFIN